MYTINIGAYTVGSTTYEDRCLSASIGGLGLQCEEIVWEGTEHQPYDYKALYTEEEVVTSDNEYIETVKHYTGEFVLDVLPTPEVVTEPTEMEQLRADVDFLLMMTE